MMSMFAVAQCQGWHDILASVKSLGFLTGVACSFVVLLVCWGIETIRRMRRKNNVLRVVQVDGGELVLTFRAIRTHVRLLLEREFAGLSLKGIDIYGGDAKSLRLHVVAADDVKLAEVRGRVCERLASSFKNDLGLSDAIQVIHVEVEEFRRSGDLQPAVEAAPKKVEEPKRDLLVPPLPEDESPLPPEPQKLGDDMEEK